MSIENVFRQLADPKKRVNTRQVYSLSQISEKDLAAFRKWWPTVDVARRLSLLRQMVDVTEDSFEVNFDPIFLLALGDEDGQVRATAIEGLWENRDVSLVAPLLYLLNEDKEERVRAEAASALDRFILLGEMDEIEPTLRDRIEDALLSVIRNDEEPNEVRRRAVEAIAYSGRPNIRQIITDAYESDDDRMQVSALCAMGRSADPVWKDIVLAELDNPSAELRFEAARAAGELELEEAVPDLEKLAADGSDREVQEAAVWALSGIGGKEARRILEDCYESDDEVLSNFADDALDEFDWLGEGQVAPMFGFAEGDEDWDEDK